MRKMVEEKGKGQIGFGIKGVRSVLRKSKKQIDEISCRGATDIDIVQNLLKGRRGHGINHSSVGGLEEGSLTLIEKNGIVLGFVVLSIRVRGELLLKSSKKMR